MEWLRPGLQFQAESFQAESLLAESFQAESLLLVARPVAESVRSIGFTRLIGSASCLCPPLGSKANSLEGTWSLVSQLTFGIFAFTQPVQTARFRCPTLCRQQSFPLFLSR